MEIGRREFVRNAAMGATAIAMPFVPSQLAGAADRLGLAGGVDRHSAARILENFYQEHLHAGDELSCPL